MHLLHGAHPLTEFLPCTAPLPEIATAKTANQHSLVTAVAASATAAISDERDREHTTALQELQPSWCGQQQALDH